MPLNMLLEHSVYLVQTVSLKLVPISMVAKPRKGVEDAVVDNIVATFTVTKSVGRPPVTMKE